MIQNKDAPQENRVCPGCWNRRPILPLCLWTGRTNQSTTRSDFKSSVDTVGGVPDAGLTAALTPHVSVCEHKRFQREAGTSRVKYFYKDQQ